MDSNKWYLTKYDDGTIFGPMSLDRLRQWAVDAYISPLDKVSSDAQNWVKAPMVPELQMDYLLELESGQYYGPTTVGAVREFLADGEITEETLVTNCKTGECRPLAEFEIFMPPDEASLVQGRSSVRENLQSRIRELEELLMEERRLRTVAEEALARYKGADREE